MTAIPTEVTPGIYTVDASHSSASFTVRHAGISKVRGNVPITSATITIADAIEASSVVAELDATGIDTGSADRDGHLKSADFFNVDANPTWTFTSTSVTGTPDDLTVTGDLTINGVTRSVDIDVEYTGAATDPFGNARTAFEGNLEISRKDFGLTWNAALETGGVLVGDKVKIALDISAIKG